MWLFKDGRLINVKILDYGGYYKASASYRGCTVWNCDATTREQAKELALFRLKQLINKLKADGSL